MYPHRIRLRGPWECEPLARMDTVSASLPAPLRMTMPCRWRDGGLTGFAGRVRCRRRFGTPARLETHERLWLTFAGVADRAEVSLNGQHLGQLEGSKVGEFEVTHLVQERNELVVEVEAADDNGGLWGEVALEIHSVAEDS